jgi:hypothetical protein
VCRSSPRPTPRTVTAAPATRAPVWSTTVPRIAAVVCPQARPPNPPAPTTHTAITQTPALTLNPNPIQAPKNDSIRFKSTTSIAHLPSLVEPFNERSTTHPL